MTDEHSLIDLKIWPQAKSLVLNMLAEIGVSPSPSVAITLIEYEPFPVAAALRFDDAVQIGSVADSPDGFIDFATRDFALFTAFQQGDPSVTLEAIVVPRAELRANPVGWLPYLLYWIAPAAAAVAQSPETAERLEAWQEVHAGMNPADFRYHSPDVFRQLEVIMLDRDDVEATFFELFGRKPSAKGALALQSHASLAELREALMASEEYRNRQAPKRAAPGSLVPLTQRDSFPGFAAAFDRPENNLVVIMPKDIAAARAGVEAAAAPVIATQQGYQPLYGLDDPQKSDREALLRASCNLLVKEFAHVQRKNQIRILDVGCNAGFTSFVLAETFPNTIGFDVNRDNIALCRALKTHSGSPAMFFEADLLEIAEQSASDFEALDAVLFLNVIHQLIFAKGIPYVKAMLGTLSRNVDLIVVELSRPAEYVPFGKGHLLPLDPAEILEDCSDATITLIKDGKRPVYTIRRRALEVNGLRVPYSKVDYSLHHKARVNRKYYYGTDSFTKVIRYTALQSREKLQSEFNGLRAMAGQNVAPTIRSWDDDGITAGRIAMERLYGTMLNDRLNVLSNSDKQAVLREVIRIGAALAEQNLCQNDFSTHNFMYMTDGSLRLIDFELAGKRFLRDPFGLFLWIANDVMAGAPEFYRDCAPEALVLTEPAVSGRVDPKNYPALKADRVSKTFGPELAKILQEAVKTSLPWAEFIQHTRKYLITG